MDIQARGRPIKILASGTSLTVHLSGLRQAWSLRPDWPVLNPLIDKFAILTGSEISVVLPALPKIPLAPSRGLLAMLMLPTR